MQSSFAVPRRRVWSSRGIAPRLLVLPAVVGLLAFAIYPFVYLLFLSASKSLLGKTFQEWVGFDNYRNALNDEVFTNALVRSVIFAIPISLIQIVLGLGIALLLYGSIRGGHLIRTLILLPLMTPPIMVAIAWRLILNPTGGLLNTVLDGLGLIDKPISILGSSRWAFPAIGLADTWQWTPFVVLLAFAALLTQPEDIREAALVDGATSWTVFWTVTLPLILPGLAAILLIRMIMAFKVFDLVYVMTGGGPGFDTTIGTFEIYRVALQQFNVGYAAAQTILFGLLVGLVTLPFVLIRDWAVKNWS
ncbi:MAG: multiple sugar transport system permease protein [Thermomicrobiales bacterium]|nr:multiple sugar transport system permease protein [Thermomicrobiales bacterium]